MPIDHKYQNVKTCTKSGKLRTNILLNRQSINQIYKKIYLNTEQRQRLKRENDKLCAFEIWYWHWMSNIPWGRVEIEELKFLEKKIK